MAGNFPFVDISGPITSGKQYGPGKAGTRTHWFMNRAGATTAVGEAFQADVTNTDSSATVEGPTSTGIWGQLIDPTANFLIGKQEGYAVIAQGIAADNAEVMGVWHGYTNALVIAASGTLGIGSPLTLVSTTNNLDGVVLSTERRFAFFISGSDTTPTSATLSRVCVLYEGMFAPGTGSFGVPIP